MAKDLGTLRAAITADTKGLHSGISKAKGALTTFGKGAGMALKPVGIAFAAVGAAATGAAIGDIIHEAEIKGIDS